MGKKDPCAVFGCNNDRLFLVGIRNMVFHCIFLGKKAIIITSKYGTGIFFSHYNLYSKKTLRKKIPKSA